MNLRIVLLSSILGLIVTIAFLSETVQSRKATFRACEHCLICPVCPDPCATARTTERPPRRSHRRHQSSRYLSDEKIMESLSESSDMDTHDGRRSDGECPPCPKCLACSKECLSDDDIQRGPNLIIPTRPW